MEMNKKTLFLYGREDNTFFEVANGEMRVKFTIDEGVLVRKGGMDTPKEHGRHVPEPRLRFK